MSHGVAQLYAVQHRLSFHLKFSGSHKPAEPSKNEWTDGFSFEYWMRIVSIPNESEVLLKKILWTCVIAQLFWFYRYAEKMIVYHPWTWWVAGWYITLNSSITVHEAAPDVAFATLEVTAFSKVLRSMDRPSIEQNQAPSPCNISPCEFTGPLQWSGRVLSKIKIDTIMWITLIFLCITAIHIHILSRQPNVRHKASLCKAVWPSPSYLTHRTQLSPLPHPRQSTATDRIYPYSVKSATL